MSCSRPTTLIALLASAATLATVAPASATTLKGVVVHRIARSHTFVVADRAGHLRAVHARRSPRTGRRVVLRARRLRNGTYSASRVRTGKRARRARVRGRVTHVNRSARTFVLSARGTSLVVRSRRRRGRSASTAANPLPKVGDVVSVEAQLGNRGEVEADKVHDGPHGDHADLEGAIRAIDVTARTLTLSADDNGESHDTVTVHLPDTFDISRYHLGDLLEVAATITPDGAFTALGSSQDATAESADDQGEEQGDDTEVADTADLGPGDTSSDGSDASGSEGDGSDAPPPTPSPAPPASETTPTSPTPPASTEVSAPDSGHGS